MKSIEMNHGEKIVKFSEITRKVLKLSFNFQLTLNFLKLKKLFIGQKTWQWRQTVVYYCSDVVHVYVSLLYFCIKFCDVELCRWLQINYIKQN